MDKIMEKLNKLSLPAVILIASVILGGFYYASQASKQRSIERQQQIEIKQDKQEQLAKELKEQEAKAEADRQTRLNTILLDACLSDADKNFSANWDINCERSGIDKKTADCTLPIKLAESLENIRKEAKDECFRRYPKN